MSKKRSPTTQKILDLTLEIIHLLTGEDHVVVKIHEMDTDRSHQKSGGYRRTQSFNMDSGILERNNEKILELTHRIIRLLTGEVPIRCEDVTVHLSMEEWEYVERHKDLYKDAMMEDHQPVITAGKSASGESHAAVPLPDFGIKNGSENITKIKKAAKGRAEAAAYKEMNVTQVDIYPTTEQTEYPPLDIKEGLASCEEDLTDSDVYKPTEHAQTDYTTVCIKEEIDSCGEGDITDPDTYPLTEHTQTEYPFTRIKIESPTWDEENLSDKDVYKPPGHTETEYTQSNYEESLEGSANPTAIKPSESFAESVKGKTLFICNECGKCFTAHDKLIVHERIHTGENPLKCAQCGKCFAQASHLAAHKLTHTGGRTFKCTECGKCFNHASSLTRHKMVHTGEKAINRNEFGKCFTTKDLVGDQPGQGVEKPFNCTECEKSFAQASHLARHKVIHTGDKNFKCTDCGKCFNRPSRLAAHKMIHTGEKPYKCPDCGESFTWPTQLASHKWVHTSEKPFSCPECGKCFPIKTQLNRHLKIHTGEKPFQCTECGKCFTFKSSLIRHLRIHSGEKPFKCTECGKGFIQSTHLISHRMIHKREKAINN